MSGREPAGSARSCGWPALGTAGSATADGSPSTRAASRTRRRVSRPMPGLLRRTSETVETEVLLARATSPIVTLRASDIVIVPP